MRLGEGDRSDSTHLAALPRPVDGQSTSGLKLSSQRINTHQLKAEPLQPWVRCCVRCAPSIAHA